MTLKSFISPYNGKLPRIQRDAFVDVSARIIGDVLVGEAASIWPMAVLRADSGPIRIGRNSSVLDLALIEAPDGYPVEVGEWSVISHHAVVHGATIGVGCLVGIGAIVLDGALLSEGSIAGAGTVVIAGTIVPPNSLVLGTPGKVVRQTTEEERARTMRQVEELYRKSREYMKP
jgi:carbonic anhydrase/acetyltransferase-like protein (isoleucine patch superfamily)